MSYERHDRLPWAASLDENARWGFCRFGNRYCVGFVDGVYKAGLLLSLLELEVVIMKYFPDFYDWLEHHPFVLIVSVIAAGAVASLVLALFIAFSRPMY